MNRKKSLTQIMLMLFGLVLVSAPAGGTVLDSVRERHLVKSAELIFEGVVSDIQYRKSDVESKTDKGIPHTFVTFKILKVFMGNPQNQDSITLRFIGGRGDEAEFLHIGGIPKFDLEDHVILFVRGNGLLACPLVGWNQGCFRIIRNALYNDNGQDIWAVDDLRAASQLYKGDFLDVSSLMARLRNPQTDMDRRLQDRLGADTLEILDPEKAKGLPAAVPRNLLLRDLSDALADVTFAANLDVKNINLSSETKELLALGVEKLTEEQAIRLNRLLLEDSYPGWFLKSVKTILWDGNQNVIEDLMTQHISQSITRMISKVDPGEGDINPRDTDLTPAKGTRVDPDNILEYLRSYISALRSADELKLLPLVNNADIKARLFIPLPQPVAMIREMTPRVPVQKPITDQEKSEADLLLKNGGNPVLKP